LAAPTASQKVHDLDPEQQGQLKEIVQEDEEIVGLYSGRKSEVVRPASAGVS
jgi:hypothetical protein